jgi:hypothetical protein
MYKNDEIETSATRVPRIDTEPVNFGKIMMHSLVDLVDKYQCFGGKCWKMEAPGSSKSLVPVC